MGQVGNPAIADTVASVFRDRAFTVHNTVSIGQLVTEWIWNLTLRLFGFAASHPVIGVVLRIALGLAAILVVLRIIYGIIARYAPSAIARRHLDVTRNTDWWSTAQALAARDDYTGAAHALYLALIAFASRAGLVSLHESKTTGDYLRELRQKPGTMDLPRFSDFTRSYEMVIYGIGTCDRDRYLRLNTLASELLEGTPSRGGVRLATSSVSA